MQISMKTLTLIPRRKKVRLPSRSRAVTPSASFRPRSRTICRSSGKTITLEVESSDIIGNVKAKIQDKEAFDLEENPKKNKRLKCPKFEAVTTHEEKIKKDRSHKKKDLQSATEWKIGENPSEVTAEKVDVISSDDEDCSRGMKKWLSKYKDSRPGLKILEQNIDEFISAHEEQLEQERKEREAFAAAGGWTVVVHQKGRKKTTDTESGITVGSVAQAAVVDKMGKKKNKDVPLDFYRFQKREAKRNEVMMLQSKFEQDKKRIQQLRAARKFRPY